LHKEIKALAESDTEKYARFWSEFGIFLKEGIAVGPMGGTDPAAQETLTELLRFRSSRTGEEGWTSLKEYVERMGSEQKSIYYVLGDDIKTVARSPHLDAFRAGDVEVLYLVDPIDGFVTMALPEYAGKPLQNVDDPSLDLPRPAESGDAPAPAVTPEEFDEVIKRFVAAVGERVKTVREGKSLVDSPCRLVSPEDAFDRDLQRFRRLTEENYEVPKKVLEINRRHPIVAGLAQRIAADPNDPLIPAVIEQLFDNALLLEGLHTNPVDMVGRIQSILAAAVQPKA
jgi:molecular chaperone HtpG